MKKNLFLMVFMGLVATGCQVYTMEENTGANEAGRQAVAQLRQEFNEYHANNQPLPIMFFIRCEQVQQQHIHDVNIGHEIEKLARQAQRFNQPQLVDNPARRTLFGNN